MRIGKSFSYSSNNYLMKKKFSSFKKIQIYVISEIIKIKITRKKLFALETNEVYISTWFLLTLALLLNLQVNKWKNVTSKVLRVDVVYIKRCNFFRMFGNNHLMLLFKTFLTPFSCFAFWKIFESTFSSVLFIN